MRLDSVLSPESRKLLADRLAIGQEAHDHAGGRRELGFESVKATAEIWNGRHRGLAFLRGEPLLKLGQSFGHLECFNRLGCVSDTLAKGGGGFSIDGKVSFTGISGRIFPSKPENDLGSFAASHSR